MPAGCRRSVSIDWTNDRFSPCQKYIAHRDIPRYLKVVSLLLSFFAPVFLHRFRLFHARSHTRETQRYRVCLNNSARILDSSTFPADGSAVVRKKNGLWVCDISRSPSRPRPVLLNPEPFSSPLSLAVPSSFFSFSPSRPGPRRSRSCLSLLYLASHGSQLRVLSRGLLGELPARRNGRGFDSGRHGILIRDSDSAVSRSRKSGPGRMSLRPMRRPGRSGTFVILMDPVPGSIPHRSILSRPKGRRNLTYLEITAPSPEKDRS